ncbi:MAG: glycolate oxidase subunit GlcE, partial [Candidatus Puniceispirillum sp.]
MIRVTSLDEAAEVITAAMADKKKLGVTAGNSKAALGRQSVYDDVIDASAMCGIIDYQPEELVLTLR